MKSQLYPPLFALLVVTETGVDRGAAPGSQHVQSSSHESHEAADATSGTAEGGAAHGATEQTEAHARALLLASNESEMPATTPDRERDGTLIITLVVVLLVIVFL